MAYKAKELRKDYGAKCREMGQKWAIDDQQVIDEPNYQAKGVKMTTQYRDFEGLSPKQRRYLKIELTQMIFAALLMGLMLLAMRMCPRVVRAVNENEIITLFTLSQNTIPHSHLEPRDEFKRTGV